MPSRVVAIIMMILYRNAKRNCPAKTRKIEKSYTTSNNINDLLYCIYGKSTHVTINDYQILILITKHEHYEKAFILKKFSAICYIKRKLKIL